MEAVDLQIIYPPVTLVNGRPTWLATGQPITAAIPTAYRRHPYLVQLYDQAEYRQYGERALPIDQYLTTPQQRRVVLFPYSATQKVIIKYKPAALW